MSQPTSNNKNAVQVQPHAGTQVVSAQELFDLICSFVPPSLLANMSLVNKTALSVSRPWFLGSIRFTHARIDEWILTQKKAAPPKGRKFLSHLVSTKALDVDFREIDGLQLGALANLLEFSEMHPLSFKARGDIAYSLLDHPSQDQLEVLSRGLAAVKNLEVVTNPGGSATLALWVALCGGNLRNVRANPDYSPVFTPTRRTDHRAWSLGLEYGNVITHGGWDADHPAVIPQVEPWRWACNKLYVLWDGTNGLMASLLRWASMGMSCTLTHLYVDRLVRDPKDNAGNTSFRNFLLTCTPTLVELAIADITEIRECTSSRFAITLTK
jgi:hypothetical protein